MYQYGISSGAAVGSATGIHGFDPAVTPLLMKGVLCLYGISSNTIWTSPPQLRITSQLQALRRGAALFEVKELPTLLAGIAASGLLLIQPSSSAFKTCYHLRHMFPVLGSRKFCIF